MISIGQRNQLVTIQQRTDVSDGQGGQTTTWSTRAQEWAHVGPLSANEAERASKLTAQLSTAVVIPFRTDVSAQDRIVLGSRTLQVESVQDTTARREELRLLCVEIVA